jgi:hypothetical protein
MQYPASLPYDNKRTMPDTQAQYRLAQAVLSGKAKDSGMSRSVAQEFVSSMHGKKVSDLPDHASRRRAHPAYKMGKKIHSNV